MLLLLMISLIIPLEAWECPTPKEVVSEEILEEFRQSRLQFSADFLQFAVHKQKYELPGYSKRDFSRNVFFSPFGIYNSLLLAFFSSSWTRQMSLGQILHIPRDKKKDNAVGAYFQMKTDLPDNIPDKTDSEGKTKGTSKLLETAKYQLFTANRIYVSKTLKVRRCMQLLFDDEIRSLDLSDPAKAQKINSWVEERTHNKIRKFILQRDKINPLIFVNAAYFKGIWKTAFAKENSKKKKFHLGNGSSVKVMMMKQRNNFTLMIDKELNVQILELPYLGGDISMLILLPMKTPYGPRYNTEMPLIVDFAMMMSRRSHESVINSLVKNLSSEKLSEIIDKLRSTDPQMVDVEIPKFKAKRKYNIKEFLKEKQVGFQLHTSDYSTLLVDEWAHPKEDIIHEAALEVDEEGAKTTEAQGSWDTQPSVFRANHPFVYAHYHKRLNLFLFLGIFNTPE